MILMDCIIIFHNLYVAWDVNLVPADVTITNYFALNKMSQVSNLVINPVSIIGYR
jgi:hypothetical protein